MKPEQIKTLIKEDRADLYKKVAFTIMTWGILLAAMFGALIKYLQ